MAQDIRLTTTVAKVLRAFLEDVDRPRYGYDLMEDTGLASGTLYPILLRLQKAGILTAEFEDIDEAKEGRPARRFYTLTPDGTARARVSMAELHAQIWGSPQRSWRLSPEGGMA
ncbi:PadR family transcriptional regulator [Nocardiopsis synnemataformans]|uniref:PadR family transcriptional regulator n=1 Tax=Nocardiopsis synnemataformans TaxID=61305 RepID=UPI003EB7D20C